MDITRIVNQALREGNALLNNSTITSQDPILTLHQIFEFGGRGLWATHTQQEVSKIEEHAKTDKRIKLLKKNLYLNPHNLPVFSFVSSIPDKVLLDYFLREDLMLKCFSFSCESSSELEVREILNQVFINYLLDIILVKVRESFPDITVLDGRVE